MTNSTSSQQLLSLLESKIRGQVLALNVELGDVVVVCERARMHDVFQILRLDTELCFDFFVSVTAVDWMDAREARFEVVYHLMSTVRRHRLRVKISVPESNPEVDSVTSLWPGANFMERECWDMMGISFKGHPDQRRILMYDEFVGHALRKDYPVQGKQSRIPLRASEVRNTAVQMQRAPLIQIRRRSEEKVRPSDSMAQR